MADNENTILTEENESTRIINLSEASEMDAGMYFVTDSSNGTRKVPITKLIDANLEDEYAAAPAKAVGDLKEDFSNSALPNEMSFRNVKMNSVTRSRWLRQLAFSAGGTITLTIKGKTQNYDTVNMVDSLRIVTYKSNALSGGTSIADTSLTVTDSTNIDLSYSLDFTGYSYGNIVFTFATRNYSDFLGFAINNLEIRANGELIDFLTNVPSTNDVATYNYAFLMSEPKFIGRDEFEDTVVSDALGNHYKLFVQDGTIKHRKKTYRNVLCFGNSISKHPVSSNLGWLVERGMASTTDNTDYVHLLESGLKVKDASANVDVVYARTWEQDFTTDITTILGAYTSNNYDLVVIQIGENVPSGNVSSLESALNAIINEMHILFPNADFMITNMFTNSADKNKALRMSSIDKSAMWQETTAPSPFFNKIAGNGAFCDNDGTLFPLVNADVWAHPSDLYMLYKANGILNALGYIPLDLERTITVTGGSSPLCHSKTVAGSIVTCIVYSDTEPTVSISDGNSPVSYVIKDYSEVTWISTPDPMPTYGIVFTMPNANVTITIG